MSERDEQYWRERMRRAQHDAAERERRIPAGEDPIAPLTETELDEIVATGGAGLIRLSSVRPTQQELLGTPGERTCLHCGSVLRKEPRRVNSWLTVLTFPNHLCPGLQTQMLLEQQTRQEREDQQRREMIALRVSPTPERMQSLMRILRLPQRTPAGLERVATSDCPAAFVDAVTRHRDVWLGGERPDKGLWLIGPTKSRKTLLLGALAFEVANWTTHRPLFWDFCDLMHHLRQQARGVDSEWNPSAARDAPMLVLDDLGAARVTETARETLFALVSHSLNACGRYGEAQVLYVATNEAPDVLVDKLARGDALVEGQRIVQRLADACDVVQVDENAR